MCPIHKGDVPVATVAYEADESGWRLFVVKTPGGFDGTAIAMGKAMVVRLTPELARLAFDVAESGVE